MIDRSCALAPRHSACAVSVRQLVLFEPQGDKIMNIRLLPASITVGLLTCGLAAFAPANGSPQTDLPDYSTHITLTGCFLHETIIEKGKQEEAYVLVRPTIGPVASVPHATCTSRGTDQAIELEGVRDHPDEQHLDSSMLGRWIEVTGRLEKFENALELREMNVKSFREVPVVPQRAEVAATHVPHIAQAVPAPAPGPPARELPRTASSLPLTGLIGVIAFAGALALRWFACRPTPQRG